MTIRSSPRFLHLLQTPQNTIFLLVFTVFLLYLVTLSNHYNGDSIEYALAIEDGNPDRLLDPYHPLLHPLGLAFYRLGQAVGWKGRAMAPLQILNALAGAICVGLMAAMAVHITRSTWLALLTGTGFAISGGVWMLSVEAEFVTPPLAASLLVLALLLTISDAKMGHAVVAVLLGFATALAFLTYVSAAFLIPVALVAFLANGRLTRALRKRQITIYLAATLLLIMPIYLGFLYVWSVGDIQRVFTQFFGQGSYGQPNWFNLPHGIYAFLRSLALYPNLSLVGKTRQYLAGLSNGGLIIFYVYYTVILLVAAIPVLSSIFWRRKLWLAHRRTLSVLAVWMILFAAFGFYWVPGDVSFWLPVLVAWWLLVALLLANTPAARPLTTWRNNRRDLVGSTLPLLAILVLGVANAAFEIGPRHNLATNQAYQGIQWVAAHADQSGLILTRCDDIIYLYAFYFGLHRIACVSDGGNLGQMLEGEYRSQPRHSQVYLLDSSGDRTWWDRVLTDCPPCNRGEWRETAINGQTSTSFTMLLTR